MIKVLEYIPKNRIAPIGGQSGYLYNLFQGSKGIDIENVEVEMLPEVQNKKEKKCPIVIKNFLKVFYNWVQIKKIYNGTNIELSYLNRFDIIHFHSTVDFYKCKKLLENYRGKTILTSHSPKPMHKEMYEDRYSTIERIVLGKAKEKHYRKFDRYAFDNADFIFFPCEYAEEPYYNNWDEYKEIKIRNQKKYKYMLSGVVEKKPAVSAKQLKKKLGIENKFILSYVGRHVGAKGYDLLKKYMNKILNNKNIVLVACGKEEPMKGLKNKNWIEIGWTKDADSYINMSDIFVLPNRETYFDLVLLEVMSIGKIVIASRTGGNKYFEKYDSGIFLYETEDEFIELVTKIKKMNEEERKIYGEKNRQIYREFYNEQEFYLRYISNIKQIYKECEMK